MSHTTWHTVCPLTAIVPGTGVCALLDGRQIALFRPSAEAQVYAIDNQDPLPRPMCSPVALSPSMRGNSGSPAR